MKIEISKKLKKIIRVYLHINFDDYDIFCIRCFDEADLIVLKDNYLNFLGVIIHGDTIVKISIVEPYTFDVDESFSKIIKNISECEYPIGFTNYGSIAFCNSYNYIEIGHRGASTKFNGIEGHFNFKNKSKDFLKVTNFEVYLKLYGKKNFQYEINSQIYKKLNEEVSGIENRIYKKV